MSNIVGGLKTDLKIFKAIFTTYLVYTGFKESQSRERYNNDEDLPTSLQNTWKSFFKTSAGYNRTEQASAHLKLFFGNALLAGLTGGATLLTAGGITPVVGSILGLTAATQLYALQGGCALTFTSLMLAQSATVISARSTILNSADHEQIDPNVLPSQVCAFALEFEERLYNPNNDGREDFSRKEYNENLGSLGDKIRHSLVLSVLFTLSLPIVAVISAVSAVANLITALVCGGFYLAENMCSKNQNNSEKIDDEYYAAQIR